jgi:MFS transporter, YNFM family, putative membrane transport protein
MRRLATWLYWIKEEKHLDPSVNIDRRFCSTKYTNMSDYPHRRLELAVFALVSASFANIYITQPILPALQKEFSTDMVVVSFTVSAVIFGIAISNLPFGFLADRLPIHPIIFVGGVLVAFGGLLCAASNDLWMLIGARFVQGIFIPALTTCLAAYLAKTLPVARLNVVMGSYVSATVLGGLAGRLLGGWIQPSLNWRYAFVTASVLVLIATFAALRGLPRTSVGAGQQRHLIGFLVLMKRWELLRMYFCAAGSFAVFSSVFNYLPFRLEAPPFNFSTEMTTSLYVVYVVGIFMGPISGRLCNRIGCGDTLIGGAVLLGISLALVMRPSVLAVVAGLTGVCAGFFTIHAAAVGCLNRRLFSGHGRANALYVLFYYLGGWLGITGTGFAFKHGGWNAVIYICSFLLLIPLAAGFGERKASRL